MKKFYLVTSLFLGFLSSNAQTVYTENMGTTASGNPTVATYTGWQNTSPITYTGTASARTTTVSTGYTGASGSVNTFFSGTAGQTLQISGINTSAYNTADLQLSFGWLTTTATAIITVETSTDGSTWTPLTIPANANTSWALKTITSGIPSSTTLSLRFTAPTSASGMRVDDIQINNVSSTCALSAGTPTTTCDAITLGTDTYTTTIPFTGGGTATYTIIATSGTVGGTNPSTNATGNITITGVNEGTNNTITITGGTCNITIPVNSPSCKPVNSFPYNETFNYTAATNLNSTQMWTILNTGDNIVTEAGNLTYSGISSTGNRATFAGAGAESFTPFTTTNSGTIYARLLVSVTDLTGITAGGSTYFALFNGDNVGGSTTARIWIRETAGQYQYGLGNNTTSTSVTWSPNTYNLGSTQYLLLSYNFTDNSLNLYENPVLPSTPSPSVTVNLATALTSIGGFMLRQDTNALTPLMIVDELAINTTVPDGLTLSTYSFSEISGLKIYPNPAKNIINITSDSFATKTAEIYSLLGSKVLTSEVVNETVNITALAKGLYVVKITEEGKTATRQLIVE